MVAVAVSGWSGHLVAAGGRGGLEVAITMFVALGAWLLWGQVRSRRRRYDALLLAALLALAASDALFSVLPVLTGSHLGIAPLGPHVFVQCVVAAMFIVAASADPQRVLAPGRWRLISVLCSGLVAVVADVVLALIVPAGRHPGLTVGLSLITGAILVAAAARFAWEPRSAASDPGSRRALLALGLLALGASRLQVLTTPIVPSDWITPRDLMRLLAFGVLAAALLIAVRRTREEDRRAALHVERERLARDIHDGIAQDLALIALHGPRIEAALGEGHPVAVAARRALASSREAIVDLSAQQAPSTAEALRDVAAELELRFGVVVTIVEGRTSAVAPWAREDLVRIAREAIVNAARHGRARHVEVTLGADHGRCLLRVADDGDGLPEAGGAAHEQVGSGGYGLQALRARAAGVGAQLVLRPGAEHGAVLEVLTSPAGGRSGRRRPARALRPRRRARHRAADQQG